MRAEWASARSVPNKPRDLSIGVPFSLPRPFAWVGLPNLLAFLTQTEGAVKLVCMEGEKLKKIRERLGESQAKFALRFGVSRQTIHHWEQRDTPSRGIGVRIINRIINSLPTLVHPPKEKGGG